MNSLDKMKTCNTGCEHNHPAGTDMRKPSNHTSGCPAALSETMLEVIGTSRTPEPAERNDSVVEHPVHYGGKDNVYEAIKVIEAWGLGFCLGNVVKYVCRADLKGAPIKDLEKARWYLDREIQRRKEQK